LRLRLPNIKLPRPLLLLVSSWSILISLVSIWQYDRFLDAYDFGNYIQAIYSATKGLPLLIQSTPWYNSGYPTTVTASSFLSSHFSPFLFILAPFYAIFPNPILLLVIEDFMIGFAAVPLFLLARRRLTVQLSYTVVFVYLLNVLVIRSALNDFHLETFVPFFLLSGLYFLFEDDWRKFTIFAGLACLIQEFVPLLVLTTVWYRWLKLKNHLGLTLLTSVILMGYFILAGQLQVFFGLSPTGAYSSHVISNWQTLGARSIIAIPLAVILHPLNALKALEVNYGWKLLWLSLLFIPTFVVFIDYKSLVLIIPWLSISLLSDQIAYYSPYTFYVSFISFGVFCGMIFGLEKLANHRRLLTVSVMVMFASSVLMVPVVLAFTPQTDVNSSFVSQSIQIVPDNVSVLATSNVFPHLANNIQGFQLDLLPHSASGFLSASGSDAETLFAHHTFVYVVLLNDSTNEFDSYTTNFIIQNLVCKSDYQVLVDSNSLFIFKLASSPTNLAYCS
jgi:uncharacterized membrane protein